MLKRVGMRHVEPGVVVEISREGLRRAYGDNALFWRAQFRDTARVWIYALGVVIGWCVLMGFSR